MSSKATPGAINSKCSSAPDYVHLLPDYHPPSQEEHTLVAPICSQVLSAVLSHRKSSGVVVLVASAELSQLMPLQLEPNAHKYHCN